MKTLINLTNWFENKEVIDNYIKNSPTIKEINWFDLPESSQLLLMVIPEIIKNVGKSNFITIKKLKKYFNKSQSLNKTIIGIKKYMSGNEVLRVNFPINLNSKNYAKLYSLMVSEGSTHTEFSLHVPEEHFHQMFKDTIKNLISVDFSSDIRVKKNKGFLRSRAPAKIRHLIPCQEHIPLIILKNKDFAREYLNVAFDAEGSAIFDGKHKRYIKLSRYVDITNFVKENLPLQKRIYKTKIKEIYPELFDKIKHRPPKTLLGESILLKEHFGIENKIELEAIKRNKTSLRAGQITARWVLFIYANNVPKFIKEINFISQKKQNKCKEMLKVKTNRPQYSALKLMGKISKNDVFLSKTFIEDMKQLGYTSPSKYIWEYKKKGLIAKIEKGKYKLLIN
ncbi:MAG: hypothetical protein ABIH82_06040 [Candidatus Woesearchaeota archaeon]